MSAPRFSGLTLGLTILGSAAVAFYVGRISVLPSTGFSQPASENRREKSPSSIAVPTPSQPHRVEPDEAFASHWDAHWREWNARPSTRARDERLLAALEELAARDALRAVSLAQNESNLILRQEMLRAALRGWGRSDPAGAAKWALTQTSEECDQAVAALLIGAAAERPADAAQVTQWLFQEKPDSKRLYGRFLVTGFNQTGDFESAAKFALTGGPGYSDEWIDAAYSDWAAHQPQAATAAATALADPILQNAALQAVISGWAPTDPRGLAEYALRLPAGTMRNSALSESLRVWASTNPAAAAAWVAHLEPAPEQDAGVAAIAMMPGFASTPEVALKWADSIFDNTMRLDALGSILRTWAETDPAKARKYAETIPYLKPNEREDLLGNISKE